MKLVMSVFILFSCLVGVSADADDEASESAPKQPAATSPSSSSVGTASETTPEAASEQPRRPEVSIREIEAGNPEAEEDARTDELLSPHAAIRTPGTDTNLCMSWEMDLSSDPNRSQRVALIQGSTLGVSTDGGDNFNFVSVAASLPPTHTSVGDGSAAYDANGRLFVAILGNPVGGGGWDVFVSEHDPTTGNLVAGPVNVTAQVGITTLMNADKPWLAADANPTGTGSNNLYLVWTLTGGGLSGDWEVWGARSTNQGQTWTQMTRNAVAYGPISPMDGSDGRCWPSNVAVAANHDVYVTYHGQPGFITQPGVSGGTPDGVSGLVVALRSTDGGQTFPQRSEPFSAGEADTTWNSQSRPGAIADASFWTIGTGQGWILPDPDDGCTLHVVTSDDPNDDPLTGDAADVVMATSTDCGVSWSAPQTVNDGPAGSWQLLPTAAIDPITGAIAVTWLDNRDAGSYPPGSAGNSRIDLRLRYSNDGGTSWLPSLIVNDAPIDPDATTSTIGSGTPSTFRIGEYNGITFAECTAHMAWAAQATCGGSMDTFYDRDPEVADLTAPDITCPDDVTLTCTDSTNPIDTGEASARDTCDADPEVIHVDQDLGGSCPPTPVIQNINRIWSTTDAAGNFNSCSQLISIQDFDAPDITVPAGIVLECTSLGGIPAGDPQIQNWLSLGSASDECSDVDYGISGVPELFPVSCESDPTHVTFAASDECGNSGFELSTVTVVDTTPPTLTPPAPETLECTAPGGTPIGHPSVVAWLATAVAQDVCSVPTITPDGPALLPAACFPGADSAIVLSASDGCNQLDRATAVVTIVDSLAPSVIGPVQHELLWPADHEYVCYDNFADGIGLADRCQSTPLSVDDVLCASSQCDNAPCMEHPGEDGDGDTVDDCAYDSMTDQLCVRAERADTDPVGRLYTVSLVASDSCGNSSENVVMQLHVPHSCGGPGEECIFADGFEIGTTNAWSAALP